MKTVLVTGGAGYIGSICVKELINKGHDVIIVDNLSKGIKRLVNEKAVFYNLDLVDDISEVFSKHNIDVVIHFAAYKAAGESMINPKKYKANIIGTENLLNMIVKYNVKKIVFSSSAAVYGDVKYVPVDENHPLKPINYYGTTKVECENLIRKCHEKNSINYVCLRYFNVIGDGGLNYLDPMPENILPIIMETVMGERRELKIFGNDYDTRDGTCVRDYVDVNDLVRAHILALDMENSAIINLGTGEGVSVTELVNAATKATKTDFKYRYVDRRDGDPPTLVASNDLAKKLLKWQPEISVEDSILSTFKTYRGGI